MGIKIKSSKHLSDDELCKQLHIGAELYSKFADTYLLFIFKKNKSEVYEMYEVFYGKRNFMHLAGIKSKSLDAIGFYNACFAGMIHKKDCTPKNSLTNMYEKVSILTEMLNLSYGKCYKIGEKNLITRDNDFEMAIGNNIGTVGCDSRVSKSGCKEVNRLTKPIPTTLLANPITEYSTSPNKIIFILQKGKVNDLYNKVFFEIKKGLLKEELINLPEYIQKIINIIA